MNRRGFFTRIAAAALAGIVIPGEAPRDHLRDYVAGHSGFIDACAAQQEAIDAWMPLEDPAGSITFVRINALHLSDSLPTLFNPAGPHHWSHIQEMTRAEFERRYPPRPIPAPGPLY